MPTFTPLLPLPLANLSENFLSLRISYLFDESDERSQRHINAQVIAKVLYNIGAQLINSRQAYHPDFTKLQLEDLEIAQLSTVQFGKSVETLDKIESNPLLKLYHKLPSYQYEKGSILCINPLQGLLPIFVALDHLNAKNIWQTHKKLGHKTKEMTFGGSNLKLTANIIFPGDHTIYPILDLYLKLRAERFTEFSVPHQAEAFKQVENTTIVTEFLCFNIFGQISSEGITDHLCELINNLNKAIDSLAFASNSEPFGFNREITDTAVSSKTVNRCPSLLTVQPIVAENSTAEGPALLVSHETISEKSVEKLTDYINTYKIRIQNSPLAEKYTLLLNELIKHTNDLERASSVSEMRSFATYLRTILPNEGNELADPKTITKANEVFINSLKQSPTYRKENAERIALLVGLLALLFIWNVICIALIPIVPIIPLFAQLLGNAVIIISASNITIHTRETFCVKSAKNLANGILFFSTQSLQNDGTETLLSPACNRDTVRSEF
jgi:hypothetical protein